MGSKPDNYLPEPPDDLDINNDDWLSLSYDQQYYRASEKHRNSIKESSKNRRDRNRKWLDNVRSEESCRICGEARPETLDFHHIRDKRESVAVMAKHDYSISSIAEEIEKCVILCANCHRVYHNGTLSTDPNELQMGADLANDVLNQKT